jgi:hypothetical protein
MMCIKYLDSPIHFTAVSKLNQQDNHLAIYDIATRPPSSLITPA